MSYEVVKPVWSSYVGQSGFGALATPPAGFDATKPWLFCGSQAATLQMLKDLGYSGTISSALSAYAMSKGMSASPVTAPLCQALLVEWQAKQAAKLDAEAISEAAAKAAAEAAAAAAKAQQGQGQQGQTGQQTGQQGQQQVVVAQESITDKAATWWKGLPTGAKVGVAVGGVAAVGALFWLLIPGKKASAPVGKYESSVEYTTGTKPEASSATANKRRHRA